MIRIGVHGSARLVQCMLYMTIEGNFPMSIPMWTAVSSRYLSTLLARLQYSTFSVHADIIVRAERSACGYCPISIHSPAVLSGT
jgi:hypothetical protein